MHGQNINLLHEIFLSIVVMHCLKIVVMFSEILLILKMNVNIIGRELSAMNE